MAGRLGQKEYTSAGCSKVPFPFVKGETSEFGNERRENKTVELMTTSSIECFYVQRYYSVQRLQLSILLCDARTAARDELARAV